jgi:hypothetical protein
VARSAEAVAKDLGVDVKTVDVWRRRFRQHRLKGLGDRPRPGRPWKFGGAVGLEIIALACEPVPKKDDGTTDRTIEELHSIDPEFREKATRICDLYLHPPLDSVVVCVDEMPGVQALRRKYPDHWGTSKGKRQRRHEFEYVRGGTQAMIAGFEVQSGEVIAHCGDNRSAASLELFMEDLAAKYPTGTVYIVWDNIHFDGKPDRWTRFNERHGHRFEFVYTPLHASWVNQIEIFFSIVQRKCLRHGSFASKQDLRSTLLDFIAHWNKDLAHPFRWTFTGYPLRSGVAA